MRRKQDGKAVIRKRKKQHKQYHGEELQTNWTWSVCIRRKKKTEQMR